MKLQHFALALLCSSIVVQSFAQDESGPNVPSLPITPDELFKALGDRYVLTKNFFKKFTDDFEWSGRFEPRSMRDALQDAIQEGRINADLGIDVPNVYRYRLTSVGAYGRTEDSIHQINMSVICTKNLGVDAVTLHEFAFINTLFKDAEVEKWLKENIASKATMKFKEMTLSLNPWEFDNSGDTQTRTLLIYIESDKPSRVWQGIKPIKCEAKLLKVNSEFIFVQREDGAVLKLKKQDLTDEELEWVKANELAE